MGLRCAILRALPTETRASEPGERSTRNAKKHTAKGLVDLVGIGSARDVQQVCDVLCAPAGGSRAARAAYRRRQTQCLGRTPPTRGPGRRKCFVIVK